MNTPLQIHLGGVADSARIEKDVQAHAQRLERYCDEIQRCQVWVEVPHGHHKKGRLYDVRIRLTVPEEELIVHDQPQGDDPRVLVRHAFEAARRQLQDYMRRRRRDVARHSAARRKPKEGGS
jgi:ribosome-associated translation inhibitor RaiA